MNEAQIVVLNGGGYDDFATQLAEAAGNPNAVRAAGTACAKNPVPLIWPCHRIIRSDGTWGTYRGGEEAKTWLLNFEAGNPAGPGAV